MSDAEKLDEPLTRLYQRWLEHASDVWVPVIVRCEVADHDGVDALMREHLGFVHHRLSIIPALTGFVPLDSLMVLARDPRVVAIESSQRTTIASVTPSKDSVLDGAVSDAKMLRFGQTFDSR